MRLVLRDFPLDQSALKAAVIAHCAGPERQPQFVEVFFAQQAELGARRRSGRGAQAAGAAGRAGRGRRSTPASPTRTLEDAVLQARLDGQEQFDIQSTPTFIIDGKTYAGDQSVEKFAAIIDPLLPQ